MIYPVVLSPVWLDAYPMDKLNNQLTNEDIQRLVLFIEEDYGSGLDKQSFTEALLLMLEEVPGFEMGPHEESDIIELAYAMYKQ